MTRSKRFAAIGALALIAVMGCLDLEVTNPNEPDADRALATPGDIEALVAGAYNVWFTGTYGLSGPGLFLSNASFQHSSPWANFGMDQYGRIPREPIVNDAADPHYGYFTQPWYDMYRALAAVADGLKALNEDPSVAQELGTVGVDRLRAYGKFVQGMAHGSIALLYDQGFILDESIDPGTSQEPVDYHAMMDAALGYFADAAALASASSFEIPGSWIPVVAPPMSAEDLARASHSMAARYRAAVARTPEERAAVDWPSIIDDVDAGVEGDWVHDLTVGWVNYVIVGATAPGWAEVPYFIIGMADQQGNYQRWLSVPAGNRIPDPEDGPILIVTDDTRFPRGATVEEQQSDPGSIYAIPTSWAIGAVWARADRGSWRWSYYWNIEPAPYTFAETDVWKEIDIAEMRLLKAEARYRLGDLAGAAALVNVSRTAAGLNATDGSGTNTSCVPKLPDGECGDLWEMLKWEKRHEARMEGLFSVPWYFDGRGWGDLYEGTPLQFPLPCRELRLLGMLPCYTFGGGGESASRGSVYDWPGE